MVTKLLFVRLVLGKLLQSQVVLVDGWAQLFANKGGRTQRIIARTNQLDVALVSPQDAARSARRAKRKTANQPDGVTLVQDEVAKMTWWESGKASDIFGLYKPTVAEEPDHVEAVVSERLKRCRLELCPFDQ
jgi:hypothetical protein